MVSPTQIGPTASARPVLERWSNNDGNSSPKVVDCNQGEITQSSAGAELFAIGVAQFAADWEIDVDANIHVDSAAAIGVVHRRGNGKLRHGRGGAL